MTADITPIVTRDLRIVDDEGRSRIVLSSTGGTPQVEMLREDGVPGLQMSLKPDGRPRIVLANPDDNRPGAVIEIDDKGAHVRFDRPEGASSYVFLNNAGGSGLVLIDVAGVRRLNAVLGSDGSVAIAGFDAHGHPVSN